MCGQPFTFQVVMCHQAQGHHEGQFLGKKQKDRFSAGDGRPHRSQPQEPRTAPLGSPPSWAGEEEAEEEEEEEEVTKEGWMETGGSRQPSALLHFQV